jgi:UDP-glucose 4-epimerase
MSRILITGGAGFIGSHLVDLCLAEQHEVLVYDNFARGKREWLRAAPNLSIRIADILDAESLARAIEEHNPSTVYHLAAMHYIPDCENDPAAAIKVNVEGTQLVLDACADREMDFVFASTGAIYDPATTTVLNEDAPILPLDVYGITKATCEQLIGHWTAKGRGRATVARLFNAVGPRETNWHLVPAILDQLQKGDRRVELGNLYPRRDYIDVRDIAAGLFALGKRASQAPLEVFNIGSGVERTVSELVEMCSEIIGGPIEVVSVPERRRKHDRPSQLADITRIRAATGWSPASDARAALQDAWAEVASLSVST